MRLTRLLLLIAGAALLLPGAGLAQDPQPCGPPPPPDPELVELVYSMIDANGDGVLDPTEVLEWCMVAHAPGPDGEPAGLMLVEPGKWHMVQMPGDHPPPGDEPPPPGDEPPPFGDEPPPFGDEPPPPGDEPPPPGDEPPPPGDEPPPPGDEPPPPGDEPPPPPPE